MNRNRNILTAFNRNKGNQKAWDIYLTNGLDGGWAGLGLQGCCLGRKVEMGQGEMELVGLKGARGCCRVEATALKGSGARGA